MHDHQCRYCGGKFICDEAADECFQNYIVCHQCFWNHDFRQFLLVGFLAVVALAATLYLFREMKKTGVCAPVPNHSRETTTGENYYENGKETSQKR